MDAPADVLDIFLQPGEFYFGEDRTRIRTLLGSCVAVTLWHPARKFGGMSHFMLPSRPSFRGGQTLDGRYADDVMFLFRRELTRTGTRPGEYRVKVFGGGRMFAFAARTGSTLDIAERNIQAARQLLGEHGFSVSVEDVGGDGHRNVMLDLWSGDVWVRRVKAEQRRRSA